MNIRNNIAYIRGTSIAKVERIKKFENWILKDRSQAISASISLFLLIGIGMSYQLWMPNYLRKLPLIPYFTLMEQPNQMIGILALIILVASLITNLLKRQKVLLLLIVLSLTYLCLEDQLRWQPWVYIYLVVFFCLFVTFDNSNSKEIHLVGFVQILLIGIYFWSGVHKINENFIDQTFSLMLKSIFSIKDNSLLIFLKPFGYIIPCMEVTCGLFLIFPRTRLLGIVLSLTIHITILGFISPLGIDTNYIIAPWNFAMIALVISAFYKTNDRLFRRQIKPYNLIRYAIIVFFWIMPLFNFLSLWDTYTSFALYADKNSGYYIAIEQSQLYKIDKELTSFFVKLPNLMGGELIDVNRWALADLNVPFYPEDRVFKKLSKHFCNLGIDNEKIIFLKVSNYPINGRYIPFKCK